MAWEDPIVEAVRNVRDAYARRFNYDLDAIYRDLKEKELKSGRPVVTFPAKTEDDFGPDGARTTDVRLK